MKILVLAATFFTLSAGCVAQTPTTEKVLIKNATYDMGKITYGKPVEYDVEITNNTTENLRLEGAKAGCGCTTPYFTPNQEFKPGESVKVKIRFNGSVMGKFTRTTDIIISGGIVKQVSFTGQGVQE